MTTKQKLESKRDVLANNQVPVFSHDNYQECREYCFKAGFDSIAPLLLEMVECLENIADNSEERGNTFSEPENVRFANRAKSALDKFNKFLEGKK